MEIQMFNDQACVRGSFSTRSSKEAESTLIYIYYDMASATEHKAIYNMSSELGVEISYSAAHQISKFVNIFLYRIVFMLENTLLFYVPIHPLNGLRLITGAPNVNFRKISVR